MYTFDAETQLRALFPDPEALGKTQDLLSYTHAHKELLNAAIEAEVLAYEAPEGLQHDISCLVETLKSTKKKAAATRASIVASTESIQGLDQAKKNLVLSMKILKRLQMLVDANNSLTAIVSEHNYQEIALLLAVVKELLQFFRPYKSIEEINQLNLQIVKTQNKLVDDIFIDFEDSFTNSFTNDQLAYGCDILELVDPKNKDKLLNWFYNLQLKEIKSIFNTGEEAGGIENLSRRYIFFQNVLKNIQTNYLRIFPKEWTIDLELSKIFCKLTNQDLISHLSNIRQSASTESEGSRVILDSLVKTLDFERYLNDIFHTTDFDKIILRLFEPYLIIWVNEQDRALSSKFGEFYAMPKIPQEFISDSTSADEFLMVLKINSVPNISGSSIELFKVFQKVLTQIIKLTNGETLVDLSKMFGRYLYDYNYKILSPILSQAISNPAGIEPIKYLTMVLNTGDYIINNITDLQNKFHTLIEEPFKGKINFDSIKDTYFELINRSIQNLLFKMNNDLKFSWRQFENNGWGSMESVGEISTYMMDLKRSVIDNSRIILPLIIRDGYVLNFCDKLVESLVTAFMNNLKLIKPLSILNIEQILLDLKDLKSFMLKLPLYANPNYVETVSVDEDEKVSKFYVKFVNSQFHKLETILNMLLTPTLPIDNLIENYFNLIKDKSVRNFRHVLSLKNIDRQAQGQYVENFQLQLTILDDSLADESPIFANVDVEGDGHSGILHHPQSQPISQMPDIKDFINSKLPEPIIPDFLKSGKINSPKLSLANNPIKMNNIEKNLRELALNGENHVNKFNENFKNIGKFFRKDNNTGNE